MSPSKKSQAAARSLRKASVTGAAIAVQGVPKITPAWGSFHNLKQIAKVGKRVQGKSPSLRYHKNLNCLKVSRVVFTNSLLPNRIHMEYNRLIPNLKIFVAPNYKKNSPVNAVIKFLFSSLIRK